MLAPVLHVLPLTTIVRERTLPVAGKVNAHLNQRVNPTDVIAEANFAREHVLLDVARTFGVSANAADKLMKVKEGDRLTQGGLVAEMSGMLSRSIKAPPVTGTVPLLPAPKPVSARLSGCKLKRADCPFGKGNISSPPNFTSTRASVPSL